MVEILLRSPHFCFTATCVLVCQDVFLKRIEHLNLAKVAWNTIFVSFIVTAVSKVKQTTFPDHKCTVTNIKSMDTDESCNYNVKKTKAQTKLKKKKGKKNLNFAQPCLNQTDKILTSMRPIRAFK